MKGLVKQRRLYFAVALALVVGLFAVGGCRAAGSVVSPHLPFGNPSDAGNSAANRVAWRLTAADIGDLDRSQFYADPEIPTPAPKDYTNSGYDCGHLCPSKDCTDTEANNKAVFTMLNIIPQAADNNRGRVGEARRVRTQPRQSGARGLRDRGRRGRGREFQRHLGAGKTWKVIVALERCWSFPQGLGKALAFAAVLPNRDGIKNDRWQQYRTSVAEVEKLTGYKFFKNAPELGAKEQGKDAVLE